MRGTELPPPVALTTVPLADSHRRLVTSRARFRLLELDSARSLTIPTAPVIRPATRADLPAIGRLAALLVRLHHELDPARFIAATPETASGYGAYIGSQLTKPDIIVLVAELDEQVVGYTFAGVEGFDYMSLRGPAGVLHDIVVDPGHRGQGIGRMLLDATVAELTTRGAPRFVLWTGEGNESAQRLFASAGFRRTMIEMTREIGGTQ
ncbi:MAG TPA: GNAT family N-acetyltransferase [Gemmatimonadaceae bacterium]|nr:GNAT family N-acetyltransferase [Gemmatimonadaceae bacterium]